MKKTYSSKLFLFFLIFIGKISFSQIIYQHNFGTATFTAVNPYGVAPTTIDANLSGSQWATNLAAGFNASAGSAGQALSLSNSNGSPTYSLSYNVAGGFNCDITAFSFWSKRSNSGATNWTLTVNGTTVGAGTTPTAGISTGTVAVSSAVNGLSGTVNVVLTLSGGTSTSGTYRVDDFTLYGSVYPISACTPPTIQASSINSSTITTSSANLSWTPGNGGNALVLIHQGSTVNSSPNNGIVYTANATYGLGQQLGTGNYVVYNGTGNSVTVTGLNSGTTYYVSVFEYNSTSGSPCYLNPGLTGNLTTLGVVTSTNCLQIKSILVAACGAPESYNEMVYFKNGSSPLPINQISIAGAPASGVFALNKWPNNGNLWFGVVQNTLTLSNVNAINASITKCGYVKEPQLVAGIATIPADANVILVGHQTMNPLVNSFANLTDTVYMIFQAAATSTAGNFTNTGAGTRGFVLIDNLHGCTSNSVTYTPALLATGGSNGDAISFDAFNNITYYNSGCQAPYIPLAVDAGANQTICYNSQAVLTATPSGVYNSLIWSGGSGTFSSPTSLTTTYTPGASDVGTVTLQCTITRSCAASTSSVSATVNISITSLPTFSLNATNGYSLCPSTSSVLSYSVTNAANAGVITPSWSSPAGSGTTYTVSAPTGTAAVTYSLNLSNACGNTPQTFTVYPLALPTVTLSSTTPTACSGSTLSLSASGNSGNYSWNNPISTSPTVTITAGTTTTGIVTSTNTCGSAQDTYTLTVTQNPIISVNNPSVSLCAGQSATVTATSSLGTYSWTPDAVNTNSIVVNAAGTHTVSTSNVCGIANATVNVSVNPAAVLSISSTSSSVCTGGQVTATLSLVGSTGTYTWSTGAHTPTLAITTPGVYTATVDAGFCGLANNTITIGTLPTPSISVAATSTLLCNGATATLTASSNLTNFSWSNGSTNTPTIVVNSANVYSVQIANGCGSPSTSINVLADITPTLSLTSNTTTLCPSQTATLTVTGGIEPYTWSTTASTSSVITISSGSTSVSYSNACGSDTKTFSVSVIPNPTVTISSNSINACPGSLVNVIANSTENNYTWSGSANTTATLSLVVSSSATGTVSTTNVCNITASDTYTINVTPSPTLTVNTASLSLCTGQSATLTATSSAGNYTWMPGGSNTNTLVVNTANDYTVYTSNVCEVDSMIVNVAVNSSPTLTISASSSSLCAIGQTSNLSLSGSGGTYNWSDGSGNVPSIIVNTPGVYTATVTTSSCGSTSASYTVDAIATPTVSLTSSSTLLCDGVSATLTASSNMTNELWSDGSANTNSIVVNTAGTYTVGVLNACGAPTASITIQTNTTPTLNLNSNSLIICPNETATLTVTGGSAPYTWSNSSSTGSVVTTNGGTVTVSSTNACATSTASVNVTVVNLNASISANPMSGITPVSVDFTNNSVGANTYLWNFGNGQSASTQTVSSQTYSVVGMHTVYLVVTNGTCSDIDSLTINVLNQEGTMVIPNVFTPNGDSINDIFRITGFNIVDFNCTIFDRWGLRMFAWDGIKNGWNGKSNDKDVPAGTYFYIINAKDIDGNETKKQGAFSLFR